jgi:hypothetical protein
MNIDLRRARAAPLLITVSLLVVSIVPLPGGTTRGYLRSARSPELTRDDDSDNPGGYYEELIAGIGVADDGGDQPSRARGKTPEWVKFHDINALRPLRGQFLQFELKPNVSRVVFGTRFSTNRFGLRDRSYERAKPAGAFRIALLGSSIDMGWGVGTNQTYENLLEDWLNAESARRGLGRRFEVLNFAVAAYGPMQRLESFQRKALLFQPDLVLYSATMLDTRLLEIHLCNLLHGRVSLKYDFARRALDDAGITAEERKLDVWGDLSHKDTIKRKLRPVLWDLDEAAVSALVDKARSNGIPIAMLIVPRVGEADSPAVRADAEAQHVAIAHRLALPLLNLCATFDDDDPMGLKIAPTDDHPNAEGHRRLFQALSRQIEKDEVLCPLLFDSRETASPQ